MSTFSNMNSIQAKEEFSELLNRVSHQKERIIITRRDKEIAVIIPIEDLALLEASQNKADLHDAVSALKETRAEAPITLESLKEEIG